MQNLDKNILIYAAIAAVVLVAVYIYASSALTPAYSISVRLSAVSQPNTIYPYDSSILQLTMNNTGSSTIQNLPLMIYVNGQQIETLTIQSLPAHNVSTKELLYIYRSSGPYNFSAIVDPSHLFNVQDRAAAQASMDVRVAQVQTPDVYLSIPNGNITDTQSFSFSQNGTDEILYLDMNYSLRAMRNVFDGNVPVLLRIFNSYFPDIARFNGASASYANGTSAYTAWLQSNLTMPDISALLKLYKYNSVNFTVNNSQAIYLKANATSSLCAYYDRGWTKLVVYNNASIGGTCEQLAGQSYSGAETNTLIRELAADPKLRSYQNVTAQYNANAPIFAYVHSSLVGSSLESDNGVLTAINLFQTYPNITTNSVPAFFAGLISQNKPVAGTSQRVCDNGIAFNGNGVSICSAYTATSTGYVGEPILLNSTEIASNYTLSLYSLINENYTVLSHFTAAELIGSLKLNESVAPWKGQIQNGCSLNSSQKVSCGFVSVNSISPIITMNLTNGYSSSISLKNVSCGYDAVPESTPENGIVVAPGSILKVTVPCKVTPLVGFIQFVGISFKVNATYTVNGQTMSSSGLFSFAPYSS